MMVKFSSLLFKSVCLVAVSALVVTLVGYTQKSGAAAGLSSSELASVHGKDGDVPGCIQYFEDWEQPSFDCWSPYGAWNIDNDCDWKQCVANGAADGCGEGTQWSGLNEATWYATSYTDPDVAWAPKSSPCTGIIDCAEQMFDDELSCFPSPLIGHFLDAGPRVRNVGCDDPTPGTLPTTCRVCAAGAPKPFNANNTNWTWYEQVDCNL